MLFRKQKPLARALKPRRRNRQLLALAPSLPETVLVHVNQAFRARALMPRLGSLELMEQAQALYFEKRLLQAWAQVSYFERRPFTARALRPRLAVR